MNNYYSDPVYQKTSWTPAKGGGTNFKTHKLVKINNERYEFKTSLGNLIFALVFLIAGLIIYSTFVVHEFTHGTVKDIFFSNLIALVFTAAGAIMLKMALSPIVFDFKKMLFWRGNESNSIDLNNVYAIQLLSEFCSSKNSDGHNTHYYSHEFNLVMENGERFNVIDHSNSHSIRKNSEIIAEILDIPIWDQLK